MTVVWILVAFLTGCSLGVVIGAVIAAASEGYSGPRTGGTDL